MEKMYILPLDVAQGYGFHTTESHYIVLPDGVTALIRCRFHSGRQIEHFEGIHGVSDGALPHPTYEPTTPISDAHVKALAHLGVVKGHTVHDVSKLAAKQNRALRIW
jgi:hypothetical protein